jgi:hypothetical protein
MEWVLNLGDLVSVSEIRGAVTVCVTVCIAQQLEPLVSREIL